MFPDICASHGTTQALLTLQLSRGRKAMSELLQRKAMAAAISSRRVVDFTCDAHHRRSSGSSTSLRQPTCATSSRFVNKQRSIRRLLKIPCVANHVENGRRNSFHFRCTTSVEWGISVNAEHYYHSIAGSEGSSLQQRSAAERSGHRDEEGSRAGATWEDGIPPRVWNRRAAVLASMAVFGVGSCCSCCGAALAAGEDWSYGGPSGASRWGGTCAVGAQQSPIDVALNKALHGEALGELQFDYKLCTPSFKNPGHGTMQVNFPEGVNKLRLKGRELNLVQFHFHTPSEHAFDGLRFPMEAHLVHQDAVTKAYAVVGVMLDASADAFSNGALAAALRYSPLEHGKTLTLPNVQVSANDLLPPKETKNDRRYIHYMGSFTTPPCTESVDWFLLEKPLRVSTTEVLEFMKFVGDEQTVALNARPIQPLGEREIYEGP